MSYISEINKGIEFIEEHINDDFELSEVAAAAGVSQWHFQRIFSALTGETLKSYIRARRLSSSMKLLLNSDKRIIEIAVDAGYESQESFTRAFQNYFNMTPGEFRKAQKPHLFIEKIKIDKNYLIHISKNISLTPDLIKVPAKKYIGMQTCFFGIDSEKNNMAEKLPPLWNSFLPRLNEIPHAIPGACYGLIRQAADGNGQLDYFSVMQVESIPTSLPDSMCSVVIPEQIYAKFLHHGEVKNMNHTVNFIYSSWLLNSDYSHTFGFDIEEYGRNYHPTSADSEISYLIPVQQSKT